MELVNKLDKKIEVFEQNLVMIRFETRYGFSNTWWRIMFIDSDGTFIGELERHHWLEYKDHKKGDHVVLKLKDIQDVYNQDQQFCYSDNITTCECEGLCRNK